MDIYFKVVQIKNPINMNAASTALHLSILFEQQHNMEVGAKEQRKKKTCSTAAPLIQN